VPATPQEQVETARASENSGLGWSAPQPLNPGAPSTNQPSMTSTPDGPVVAWGESSTTYIARYAGGGFASPEQVAVNAETAGPLANRDYIERVGARVAMVALLLLGCGEPIAPRSVPVPVTAPKSQPPPAEQTLRPELAAGPGGRSVIDLILELRDDVHSTRYQPRTEIDPGAGHYAWDCSGMANWILRRAAPRARRSLRRKRPRAIDYYRAITRAPTDRARRGWRRLEHISEARPGDLFAFPRSPISTSKISGHVGFFVGRPWRVPVEIDGREIWAARILDATGLPHQDDTRDSDSEGGFGFGTFAFVNDRDGETIAYGWFGTASRGFVPTHVAYGRVAR
jgi:hypothetical protein